MALALIQFHLNYGGRSTSADRTLNFKVKTSKIPGNVDFSTDANNLANVLKTILVANARIQYIKFTQLPGTTTTKIPHGSFQRVDVDIAGTITQATGTDAAIIQFCETFKGDPQKGNSSLYKIPFSLLETQALANTELGPDVPTAQVTAAQTFATNFFAAFTAAGTPIGVIPNVPDMETNFKVHKTFKYNGPGVFSATKKHVTINAKERALIRNELGVLNRQYEAALYESTLSNNPVDPAVITEIKAKVAALKTQWTAGKVASVGYPVPLNSLIGAVAQD